MSSASEELGRKIGEGICNVVLGCVGTAKIVNDAVNVGGFGIELGKEIKEEFFSDSDEKKKKQIEIPFSASDCKGKKYELVEHLFIDAGFKNVMSEGIDDIRIGVLKKDGIVDHVTINGSEKFKKHQWFDKSAKIRIVYHKK